MTNHDAQGPAEEAEIISIKDDSGEEMDFEVIMKFEVDEPTSRFADMKYMMVVPLDDVDQTEEADEVYAFRYDEDGDDLTLHTIDDEEEWDMVEETFHTLLEEFDGEI